MRLLGAAAVLPLLLTSALASVPHTVVLSQPADALSVAFAQESDTGAVSYFDGEGWSDWQELHVENEQDPTLLESNLIVFPDGVTTMRFSGHQPVALHPVQISDEPAGYFTAATSKTTRPRVLSRTEWGADENLLYTSKPPSEGSATNPNTIDSNGGGSVSQRVKDCEEMQNNYPAEFKVTGRTTTTPDGKRLRWPHEYSKSVKILAVHHTAIAVGNDDRSGVERVRALYQYHAQNRGWGDVGYHYLIDEDGQIYEGKAGGKNVVGGHAYCNNISSIGVAMLGNFDIEEPTQEQIKALQWLLTDLAVTYRIDLTSSVTYHGKKVSPVLGHRDLLSTDCPGFYAYGVLDQIRENVADGNVNASVKFPVLPKPNYTNRTDDRRNDRLSRQSSAAPQSRLQEGVSPLGGTVLEGRPGDQVLFSMRYQAGDAAPRKGSTVSNVVRDERIGLWQEKAEGFVRVRSAVELTTLLPSNGTAQIRFKLQYPMEGGSYTMSIGPWNYQVNVSGRRARAAANQSSSSSAARAISSVRTRPRSLSSSSVSSVSFVSSVRPASSRARRSSSSLSRARSSQATVSNPTVRIRLGLKGVEPTIAVAQGSRVGDKTIDTSFTLKAVGDQCAAIFAGAAEADPILRILAKDGTFTITDESGRARPYRGILECRVLDAQLVLINELPMEDYLAGLAEEPDTEPYEKQRAFAITARTYAAYYLSPTQRKFPGKPYDGSDSPAEFQAYGGLTLERANPRWVQAVQETAGLGLLKDGQVIRPPYFSSDDGRTRSPDEAGWKNFPFAEIFASKPDPWCEGMTLRGHGVGMSGCGSEAQANEGKTAEEILEYYYPGTTIDRL